MPPNAYNPEGGNVLFLILIAVALFAALSYAVTQSTRSGGGDPDRETAILGGASLTQYPASLRTATIRLILSGTSVDQILFDAPSQANTGTEAQRARSLFLPTGGGALFQEAPANTMANAAPGSWVFNGNFEINDIGLSGAGGNELIAFLPGISSSVCESVNKELSFDISGCVPADLDPLGIVPEFDASSTNADRIDDNVSIDTGDTFPNTALEAIDNTGCPVMDGQPSGCFYDTDNSRYVYCSVLLER